MENNLYFFTFIFKIGYHENGYNISDSDIESLNLEVYTNDYEIDVKFDED